MDRRKFVKCLVGGSALSLYSLSKANAAIYQHIAELNQDYLQELSPDGVYWEGIRSHYLFENNLIMMNNGTLGPMPEPVYRTLINAFKVQVTNPYKSYSFLPSKKEEVRTKLARFINASADEVAITRNTTMGMNFVANGLDMEEGDEVIVFNLEHPGGINPWRLKERRCGIKIVPATLGVPPENVEEIVELVKNAITPRTKIISISHTVYITGLIAPLRELSQLAHDNGILILVDSAHGLGMVSLNMREFGVDFLASSPYKWMGAPTGVGLLYVRQEVQDKVLPTIASSGWDSRNNARRYETLGQGADPLIIALGEALDFQNIIGKERIDRRIKSLAGRMKQELSKMPRVRLHTNMDTYLSAGLTAFSIEGIRPTDIVNYLREKYNIVIRTVGSRATSGVRVSTNIYLADKHVDMLLEGVDHLIRYGV